MALVFSISRLTLPVTGSTASRLRSATNVVRDTPLAGNGAAAKADTKARHRSCGYSEATVVRRTQFPSQSSVNPSSGGCRGCGGQPGHRTLTSSVHSALVHHAVGLTW
eukprot:1622268-Pyramimonas_sp.AAC.1